VGFEPTIPAFEREKIVHALDREATVIGFSTNIQITFPAETQVAERQQMEKQVSVEKLRLFLTGIRIPTVLELRGTVYHHYKHLLKIKRDNNIINNNLQLPTISWRSLNISYLCNAIVNR
jgi:hypothetical protein